MILGYTRVSTSEQAKAHRISLAEQDRIVKGFAIAKGASQYDVQVFSDPGVSGSIPLHERPAGKELLATVKSGDVVIAAKLDRMFRSASDALEVAEQFKKDNVELIFWDMGHESITRSAIAKCFFTMASAFAELERERIHERICEGRHGKKARGGHLGGHAPYGYRVVGVGRESRLEINDNEIKIIQLVQRLCRRFKTMTDVERWMDRKGVRDRAGHPFRIVQLQRLRKRKLPEGVPSSGSPEPNFSRSLPSSVPTAPPAM